MILDKTAAAFDTILKAGTALTSQLSGTAAIYDSQAPDASALPYVVFSHQGGGPTNLEPVVLEDDLWYVRAYSATSQKNATEIFGAADALLNRTKPTITGFNVFWCAREQNIRLVENLPNGEKIWSCGAFYRIRAV